MLCLELWKHWSILGGESMMVVIMFMLLVMKNCVVNLTKKVNDERLCSTQWVVSLNVALSPSSCVVIQDKEYYHMLGKQIPAQPINSPQTGSRSRK